MLSADRRNDVEMRAVVDEGLRQCRRLSPTRGAAYMLRYSVPVDVVIRVVESLKDKSSESGNYLNQEHSGSRHC